MCDRCDADQLDRRAFLKRAAVVGGATAAGAVLLPDVAEARAPPAGDASGSARTGCPAPHALAVPRRPARQAAGPPPALRAPAIVSRAQWGADESIRTSERAYAPDPQADRAPHRVADEPDGPGVLGAQDLRVPRARPGLLRHRATTS